MKITHFIFTVSFFFLSHAHATDPNISHLFAGLASFQSPERVTLGTAFHSKMEMVFDQKLAVFYDNRTQKYYAYTRGNYGNAPGNHRNFGIFLLSSTNGKSFTLASQQSVFPSFTRHHQAYDPQIASYTDNGVKKYLMSFECGMNKMSKRGFTGPIFGPSLCVSFSRNPTSVSSWTAPKVIIKSNKKRSASTGATLKVGNNLYTSWTMVNDREAASNGKSKSSTTTWGAKISVSESGLARSRNSSDVLSVMNGHSGITGELLGGAVLNDQCRNSWDCNGFDGHDWIYYNGYYYMLYLGTSFFRVIRPGNNSANLPEKIGFGIARSRNPLGYYSQNAGPVVLSDFDRDTPYENTIDDLLKLDKKISYPTFYKHGNAYYIYFSRGSSRNYRVKLKWNRGDTKTRNFISNLYFNLTNKNAKASQLNAWMNKINSKSKTIPQLIKMIALSPEVASKLRGKSTTQKVNKLFRGMFNRPPNSNERNIYLRHLTSRNFSYLVHQMIHSEELVKSFNVVKNKNSSTPKLPTIEPLYRLLLGRNASHRERINVSRRVADRPNVTELDNYKYLLRIILKSSTVRARMNRLRSDQVVDLVAQAIFKRRLSGASKQFWIRHYNNTNYTNLVERLLAQRELPSII